MCIQSSVRRYKIVDQVYDILKAQIVNGVLKPGQEISVDELARKLKTSKTPIREALHRLKGEGLVVDSDKGKMSVVSLSSEEVAHISEVYAALQTFALKWGFDHIPLNKVKENLKMLREAKKDLEEGNPEPFLKADVILHDLIANSAGNACLSQILSNLRCFIAIIRNMFPSLERYKEAWEDHMAVVQAILRGDKEAAIKNMNLHTEHVKQRLLASLEEQKGEVK